MRVLFLRHAEAEDRVTTDEARALTAKGRRQAARVGRFLRDAAAGPCLLLASPLVRAAQTAALAAEAAGWDAPREAAWLACGMTPDVCLEQCSALAAESPAVILVGHEPDFSEVIGVWIGGAGEPAQVRVKKASLTALDVSAFAPGGACLEFSMPVRLLNYAS